MMCLYSYLAETVFEKVAENVTEELTGNCAADEKDCKYEESPANKYKVPGEWSSFFPVRNFPRIYVTIVRLQQPRKM